MGSRLPVNVIDEEVIEEAPSEEEPDLPDTIHESHAVQSHTVHYMKRNVSIRFRKVLNKTISMLSQCSTKEAEEPRKILKVAKTVAVVYGCFMVCWLPLSIFAPGLAWSHTAFSTAHGWPHVVIAEILPVLNSTMNPIIYLLRNKVYMKAFRNMSSRFHHRMRRYASEDGTASNN